MTAETKFKFKCKYCGYEIEQRPFDSPDCLGLKRYCELHEEYCKNNPNIKRIKK